MRTPAHLPRGPRAQAGVGEGQGLALGPRSISPSVNTQLASSFPMPHPSLVATTPRPHSCQPLTTLTLTQTQACPVQAPNVKILGVCELRLIPTDPVATGTLAGRRGSQGAGPRLSKTKPSVFPILGPPGPEGAPGGSLVPGVVTICYQLPLSSTLTLRTACHGQTELCV